MKLWYEQQQHVRKSFYKTLLNSAHLRSRAQLAPNKKQECFSLPDWRKKLDIDENVIQQNTDKMHPISQPKNSKKRRILKFTSNNSKQTVFIKH